MPPPFSTLVEPPLSMWKSSKVTVLPGRIVKVVSPGEPTTMGEGSTFIPVIVTLRSMVTVSVEFPTSCMVWQLALFTADWTVSYLSGTVQAAAPTPCTFPFVFACLAKVGSAPAAIVAAATSVIVTNNIVRLISATSRKERGTIHPTVSSNGDKCDGSREEAQLFDKATGRIPDTCCLRPVAPKIPDSGAALGLDQVLLSLA